MIKVDLSGAEKFFGAQGPDWAACARAHETLAAKNGAGNDFLGWLELPQRIEEQELTRIVAAGKKIRALGRALVVIGIGGSYLGARAAYDLLGRKGDGVELFFAGNGLSATSLRDTLAALGDRDFCVNVVSKSGTTLEPALGFRIFRELLEKKYGAEGARERIFATTDARRGALKSAADAAGWECFVVPDDVGGRFSVLSAVGLLPLAAAGLDVEEMIRTAKESFAALDERSEANPPGAMPPPGRPCTARASSSRSWPAMSPGSAWWPSGGSSSTARARARKVWASTRPAWSTTPISTPWASTSRRDPGI